MKINRASFITLLANMAGAFIPSRRLRHTVRRKIRNIYIKKLYTDIKQEWNRRGPAPIPARYTEYDVVLAIGARCAISDVLKCFKLRTFSNPFEWTEGLDKDTETQLLDSGFIRKITALYNDFEDYFNFEDFEIRSGDKIYQHLPMVNKKHRIGWWHIFPLDQSWERSFPAVREKVMRRFNRMIEKISNSNRILFVWSDGVLNQRGTFINPVSDDDIKSAMKMLAKKWPGKHFDIVFFQHDGTKDKFEFDKIQVCEGAYRIKSNHFDLENAYMIKHAPHCARQDVPLVMSEMLDNIKLNQN